MPDRPVQVGGPLLLPGERELLVVCGNSSVPFFFFLISPPLFL